MAMKALIAATALAVLPTVACAEQTAAETTAETVATADSLSAALIYADWCGACQTLDPNVEAAKASGAFEDVNYARLDYTARDKAAFYGAADEAGIGEAIRSHLESGVKTGQLLLIDTDAQTVIGTIRRDMDADQIAATVTAAKG